MPSDGVENPERFRPRAAREMASMFDHVSGRYDLLNRLMTLGQDGAWRDALARAVPERATSVLDLCTGSGVSLTGLRRVGRLVLGVDVSLEMLRHAQETQAGRGWAPRIVCADAFRLPFAPDSLDAVTIAFGVRNLRPRSSAVEEIARVLRPGGTLAVLEAAAPGTEWSAALHALYLRHGIPLLGRLSPDPSAYRYLSESIFEFGVGTGFEEDLRQAGLDVVERRSFMLGATKLWVAEKKREAGRNRAGRDGELQAARSAAAAGAAAADARASLEAERIGWGLVQWLVSVVLFGSLMWSLAVWAKLNSRLPLADWQRRVGWVLLIAGLVLFAARTLSGLLRFARGSGRG